MRLERASFTSFSLLPVTIGTSPDKACLAFLNYAFLLEIDLIMGIAPQSIGA